MRIEFVIDVPGVHDAQRVDAVHLAHEAVRSIRNDTGVHAEVVHVAVGNDIAVPRDFNDAAPIVNVEPSLVPHDPNTSAPTVEEERDDNGVSPYSAEENIDPQFIDRSPYTDENKPWAEQMADAQDEISLSHDDAEDEAYAQLEGLEEFNKVEAPVVDDEREDASTPEPESPIED